MKGITGTITSLDDNSISIQVEDDGNVPQRLCSKTFSIQKYKHWLQLIVDLPASCLCSIQEVVNELDYNSDSSEDSIEQTLQSDEDIETDMSIINQMLYEVVKYFCKVHLKDILAFLKEKLNKKRTMRLRAMVGKVEVGMKEKIQKYPDYMCKVCGQECKEFYDLPADYSVECSTCEEWYHYPCEGLKGTEDFLQEGSTLPFKCTFCKMDGFDQSQGANNDGSRCEVQVPVTAQSIQQDTVITASVTNKNQRKRKISHESNIPCKKVKTASGRCVKAPVCADM